MIDFYLITDFWLKWGQKIDFLIDILMTNLIDYFKSPLEKLEYWKKINHWNTLLWNTWISILKPRKVLKNWSKLVIIKLIRPKSIFGYFSKLISDENQFKIQIISKNEACFFLQENVVIFEKLYKNSGNLNLNPILKIFNVICNLAHIIIEVFRIIFQYHSESKAGVSPYSYRLWVIFAKKCS